MKFNNILQKHEKSAKSAYNYQKSKMSSKFREIL